MTQVAYICLALVVGVGSAIQVSLVGSLARQRGTTEAAWISVLATLVGLALILGARAAGGGQLRLPSPFGSALALLVVGVLAFIALRLSMQGLDFYLSITGLFGLFYLMAAGFLAPRVGIA